MPTLLPQSSVQKWGAQFQERTVFPQANIQTSTRSYLYFREIQVPSCGGHWVAQENKRSKAIHRWSENVQAM